MHSHSPCMASSSSPLHSQPPSTNSQPPTLPSSTNVVNIPNQVNGSTATQGYPPAYGSPYLHQPLQPQQPPNSTSMVLPPRFPAGYANNGTVPHPGVPPVSYHVPFSRSDTPTSQELCMPPANVYMGSPQNQSLQMRPGLPHVSRMVAYPPQYYLAPGVTGGPMYMQGAHPAHYVYAPHPQHMGMRPSLHHMHSGSNLSPFMSIGDQTMNAPNTGSLPPQQQNGTSGYPGQQGIPGAGNSHPPTGLQPYPGGVQNVNKYGKMQADDGLSESSQSSPYTKKDPKGAGHRKKDSYTKAQNEYSLAQASPHSSSTTSHDLSDARRLLSSSPGLSSSSLAPLSNLTTASMNTSSGGKVNSQSYSASNTTGDNNLNVHIPTHITGSVRKLFQMGNEPERGPWLEEYLEFMRSIGKPLTAMPHVAKSHLDLYKLYHYVQEHGGVMEVVKRRLWKDITQVVHVNASASATFTLRRNYVRYLLDYECHFALNGADPEPLAEQIELLASKKKRKPSVPVSSSAAASDNMPPSEQCLDSAQHFTQTRSHLPSSGTNGNSIEISHYTNGGSTLNSLLCMAGDGDSHSTSMSVPSGSDMFHSQYSSSINPTAPSTCQQTTPPLMDSIPCDQSSEETATYNTDISLSKDVTSATSSETKDKSASKKPCFLDSVIDEVSSSSFNLPSRHQMPMSLAPVAANVAPLDALLVSSVDPPSTIDRLLSSNDNVPPPSSCVSSSSSEFTLNNDTKNGLLGQCLRSTEASLRTSATANHRTIQRISTPGGPTIRSDHRRLPGCLPTDSPHSLSSPPLKKLRTSLHPYPHPSLSHTHPTPFSNHSVMPQPIGEVLPFSSHLCASLSSNGHESVGSLDDSFTQLRSEKQAKLGPDFLKPTDLQPIFVGRTERSNLFPTDSVECVKPNHSAFLKRRRITEKEIGSIDLWRVTMGLKSGLLAEVAWSIDCLTVLSYDTQSSQQLNLSHLPYLLDQIVDLFRHALWHAFPLSDSDSPPAESTSTQCENAVSLREEREECSVSPLHEKSSSGSSTLRDPRSNRMIYIEPPRPKDALANARFLELSSASTTGEHQSKETESSSLLGYEAKGCGPLKRSLSSPSVWPYLMDPLLHNYRVSSSSMEDNENVLFVPHSHLQRESALARCVCLSSIIRNLSFITQNESILASHKSLLSLLGSLLLKQHSNSCTPSFETISQGYQDYPFISLLLENSLVTLIHLAGNLYLKKWSENVARPILEGIIHWLVCNTSLAKAPLRNKKIRGRIMYRSSEEHLSPHRLALECLTRLSVLEGNVDLILATPSSRDIQRLFDTLAYNIAPGTEDHIVREMALRCLTYLCRGWEWVGTHFICSAKPSAISSMLTYLEATESRVQDIINKEGIDALRRNPEMIGTSLDLLRRVGVLMENLGQIETNQQYFIDEHVARLLDLCTSRVLDHQVVRSLINLMHIIHKRGGLANCKIIHKRPSLYCDEEASDVRSSITSRSKPNSTTNIDSHVTLCSSVLVMST